MRIVGGQAPGAGQIPIGQATLKAVGKWERIVQGASCALERAVGGECAVSIDGINAVVIWRVERKGGVGKSGCTLVGDSRHQDGVDACA